MTAEVLTLPNAAGWQRRFFTIWLGQAFSMFGSSLVQFALVWWITQTAGTATALAIGTLVGFVPQVVLGPMAGALVDRWNRRWVMMIADSITALCVLVLAFLFASNLAQIWHIYVLMFIRSVCGSFQWPAMQASTSLMVPKDQLTRIGGMNQTLQGLMSVMSPPAGALLMGLIPMQSILLIDVVTAAIAVGSLVFVSIPQPIPQAAGDSAPGDKPNLLKEMREGLQFVLNWRGLFIIVMISMLLNFVLTPAGSLIPLLVKQHFNGGTTQLATLEATLGIAVIGGGILLSTWGGFKRRMVTSAIGIILIGTGFLSVGLAPTYLFGVAVAGMGVLGLGQVMANGPVMAVFQALIPNHMQGRVMSLLGSAGMLMAPISLAVAGPVSDLLGLRLWYWIGGGLCIITGIVVFFIRPVMNIESEDYKFSVKDQS